MIPVGDELVDLVGLRYKNVEAALAEVLEISEGHLPAFRARLRHLRNLLPIPKTGKGSHISYTFNEALIMLIAVQLNLIGVSPVWAAAYAYWIKITVPSLILKDQTMEDVYFILKALNNPEYDRNEPIQAQCAVCVGMNKFNAEIQEGLSAFLVINVTNRAKSLLAAIRAQQRT